jgi:hypothetical protein
MKSNIHLRGAVQHGDKIISRNNADIEKEMGQKQG